MTPVVKGQSLPPSGQECETSCTCQTNGGRRWGRGDLPAPPLLCGYKYFNNQSSFPMISFFPSVLLFQHHGNKCADTHPPRTPAWPCGPPRWLRWRRRLSPPSGSDGERRQREKNPAVPVSFHLGRRGAINLSEGKNKDVQLEGDIKTRRRRT